MKTIQEIKDIIAIEEGFDSFSDLHYKSTSTVLILVMEKVADRYAKQFTSQSEIKNTEKDHNEMIEFIKGAFQCYVGGSDRRLLFDFLNKSSLKIVRK